MVSRSRRRPEEGGYPFRLALPKLSLSSDSPTSHKPPLPPTDCCGKGCPNCVWIRYAERLVSYHRNTARASEEVLSRIDDPILKAFLQLELKDRLK